jgi:hypothetical protein
MLVHNTIQQYFFLEEEDVQEDEDAWVLLVGEDAAAGWSLVTGVGAGPGLVIAGLLERLVVVVLVAIFSIGFHPVVGPGPFCQYIKTSERSATIIKCPRVE